MKHSDRMGADLPDRGQSHNTGFGATKADLKRGHLSPEQPRVYDDPSPQKRDPGDSMEPKGFVNRSGYNTER